MNNILQFPLRPATGRAEQQTIFAKLKDFGVLSGFVLGVNADGYPLMFCDPELGIGDAFYLLENARMRLTRNLAAAQVTPPPPPPTPKAPA